MRRISNLSWTATVCVLVGACATLGQLIQPPSFRAADNQPAQLRIVGPSVSRPLGGLTVRLYANVQNPNAFGLTLTRLTGNLFLENTRTAEVDLPLGLPMRAAQDTVLPIDVSVSFSDIPAIVSAVRQAVSSNTVNYRLDGSFGVDAGALGQPSFGPKTLFGGSMQVIR